MIRSHFPIHQILHVSTHHATIDGKRPDRFPQRDTMSDFSALRDHGHTIHRLRQALRQWEGAETSQDGENIPEWKPLPSWLPMGERSGSVLELVGTDPAVITLAIWLAGRCGQSRVVIIDQARHIFPLAFSPLGLSWDRLLVVHPPNDRLALWAVEQSLRCPGVGATLCRLGPRVGATALRRLKLAAEAGGGLGLLCRPTAREAPFSDLRLAVGSVASAAADTLRPRLEIETVYRRGCPREESSRFIVELSADASLVPVLPPMARPAHSSRRFG